MNQNWVRQENKHHVTNQDPIFPVVFGGVFLGEGGGLSGLRMLAGGRSRIKSPPASLWCSGPWSGSGCRSMSSSPPFRRRGRAAVLSIRSWHRWKTEACGPQLHRDEGAISIRPPAAASSPPTPRVPCSLFSLVPSGHDSLTSSPSVLGGPNHCPGVPLTSLQPAQAFPWRRAWPPTPVSLPGESQGRRSLAGATHSPWGSQRVGHD